MPVLKQNHKPGACKNHRKEEHRRKLSPLHAPVDGRVQHGAGVPRETGWDAVTEALPGYHPPSPRFQVIPSQHQGHAKVPTRERKEGGMLPKPGWSPERERERDSETVTRGGP